MWGRNDGWRCRRRGGFNGKRKRGSQIGKSSGRGITGEPKPARGRFAPTIYKEVFF